MKPSGKIGSNGVEVSDNVEKRFENYIYIYIYIYIYYSYALDQARSTFYVVQVTSTNFGLLAGNMQFSTHNKE